MSDLRRRIRARMIDYFNHTLQQPGIDNGITTFDHERYSDYHFRQPTTAAPFTNTKQPSFTTSSSLPITPPQESTSNLQPLTIPAPLLFTTPHSPSELDVPASPSSSHFGPPLPTDTTWDDNLLHGLNSDPPEEKLQDMLHPGNKSTRYGMRLLRQQAGLQEELDTEHNEEGGSGGQENMSRYMDDAHDEPPIALPPKHHHTCQLSKCDATGTDACNSPSWQDKTG